MEQIGIATTATPFVVHVGIDAERAQVRLIGELDVGVATRAEEGILQAERAGAKLVELDLSALEFIDSTGLRLMLEARERAAQKRWQLVLRAGPPPVHRVFEMTAVARFFEFVD